MKTKITKTFMTHQSHELSRNISQAEMEITYEINVSHSEKDM